MEEYTSAEWCDPETATKDATSMDFEYKTCKFIHKHLFLVAYSSPYYKIDQLNIIFLFFSTVCEVFKILFIFLNPR